MVRRIAVFSVVLAVAVTARDLDAQARSAAARGALIGAPMGGAAGLLFAYESCDGDPCVTSAYLVGAVAGAALFAGMGAIIAPRVAGDPGSRGARNGAILGGVLGALGGVLLIATTCDSDECGPAGYTSLGLTGGAILAAVGSMIGSGVAGSRSQFRLFGNEVVPLLGASSRGLVFGVRSYN